MCCIDDLSQQSAFWFSFHIVLYHRQSLENIDLIMSTVLIFYLNRSEAQYAFNIGQPSQWNIKKGLHGFRESIVPSKGNPCEVHPISKFNAAFILTKMLLNCNSQNEFKIIKTRRPALAKVSQAAAHISSGLGEQNNHSFTPVASARRELSPTLWKVPGKGKGDDFWVGRPELWEMEHSERDPGSCLGKGCYPAGEMCCIEAEKASSAFCSGPTQACCILGIPPSQLS